MLGRAPFRALTRKALFERAVTGLPSLTVSLAFNATGK